MQISIGKKVYSCEQTMGALFRFKQETGREITEIDTQSITDVCTFLWCCVVSAAKRDGKEFNMSLMEFADSVSPEDMMKWVTEMQGDGADDAQSKPSADEKKSLQ